MFPDATTSPVERFELATNDVDRAHEALRETYSDHEVQLRGDAEHFAYRQLTAVAGPWRPTRSVTRCASRSPPIRSRA